MDIVQRPTRRWCVAFDADVTQNEAAFYEAPYQLLQERWKAENDHRRAQGERPLRHGESNTAATWWIYQRSRPELRAALAKLSRFIATTEVSKHRTFVWFERGELGSGSVYCFARDDNTTFGILHSRFHELWSLRMGTSLA